MIELTQAEQRWIKLAKGHYDKTYPLCKRDQPRIDYFKPMFTNIYGWDAGEFQQDFESCLLLKLMDILLKIKDRLSDENHQLHEVLKRMAFGSEYNQESTPAQRGIYSLFSWIATCSHYDENGEPRYFLPESNNWKANT